MKLTKKDGYYHKKEFIKEKNTGTLETIHTSKKTLKTEKEIKKYVEERFNECIEGRIYKEFSRIDKDKDARLQEVKNTEYTKYDAIIMCYQALYFFIYELYTNKNDKSYNIDLLKNILLPEPDKKYNEIIGEKQVKDKNGDNKKISIKIKLQYKITKHEHFIQSEKNSDDSIEKQNINFSNKEKENFYNTSFTKLFTAFQEDLKTNKKDNFREYISYKTLQNAFKEYKERKIQATLKSIINNKIATEKEEDTLTYKSHNQKYFQKLFEKLIRSAEKNTEEETLEKECTQLAKNIKLQTLYKEITQHCLEIDKENKEIENSEKKNKKYKSYSINPILTQWYKEQIEEKCTKGHIGIRIYNTEVIKYISSITSSKKQDVKNKHSDSENTLQFNCYLAKTLCIQNGEGNYETLKAIINEHFRNRFTSFILDYGKRLYYTYYDNKNEHRNELTFTTQDMEYIKAKESLTRKMATLISFAGHSFYQLFDLGNEQDILGRGNTKKCIKKLKEKQLNYFFDINDIYNTIEKKNDFVCTLSEAIYAFRNGVAHFKPIEFNNVFIDKEENKEKELIEIVKTIYQKQIETIPKRLQERFLSNNLEYYFTKEELKKYFALYTYTLEKATLPYASNFKRILNKGKNLQKHKKEQTNYWYADNENSKTNNSASKKEQPYCVIKNFLLKELYYSTFFTAFLNEENTKLFFDAVKNVFASKLTRAKESISNPNFKVEQNNAYKTFERIGQDISIAEYIATLHKILVDRTDTQRFNQKNQKKTAHIVEDFIEDIFLEGFTTWLDKNNMQFLQGKKENKNTTREQHQKDDAKEIVKKILKEQEKKWKDNISKIEDKDNKENNTYLSLYLLLSMIDATRLMQFKNEVIRYEQFMNKTYKNEGKKYFINTPITLTECKGLCEIILLTQPRLQTSKIESEETEYLFEKLYKDEYEYEKLLKKFIEPDALKGLREKHELYFNEGGKPILYSNIEKTRKFSTHSFLATVIENTNQKYTKKNSNEKIKYNILDLHEERRAIHEKWKNSKNLTVKELNTYKDTIKDIAEYNYLEHKEKLHTIYNLHEITSDIMGRFVAFIHKWERDFEFFMIALQHLTNSDNVRKFTKLFLEPQRMIKELNLEEKLQQEYPSVSFFKKARDYTLGSNSKEHCINKMIRNLFYTTQELSCIQKLTPFYAFKIRNYISHFNHIQQKKYSFLDQMNALIQLFSYDKKMQNHINKSIKTLLEKYNMEIFFKINETIDKTKGLFTYKIANIESTVTKHLGGEVLILNHQDEFLHSVKALLLHKKVYVRNSEETKVGYEKKLKEKQENTKNTTNNSSYSDKHNGSNNREDRRKERGSNKYKPSFHNPTMGNKLQGFQVTNKK